MTTKRKSLSSTPEKNFVSGKWIPGIIFILGFLLYAATIQYDYTGDDRLYTFKNIYVEKGISSFYDIISRGTQEGCIDKIYRPDYRPLVIVNLALERTLFGNKPMTYHFFNVLFYALICTTLFSFLRRILKEYPLYVPALITILFTVHPLHTEVVSNIKSRDELLCLFFGILTLRYLFDYCGNKKTTFLLFSCLFYFLCILSKESGYSFFGLIPLVMYFFTDLKIKKIVINTLPFLAVVGMSIFLRFQILGNIGSETPMTVYENSLMAATNGFDQLATNFYILLHALYLLFIPLHLSWDYSFNQFPIIQWNNVYAILSLIIHLFLLIIAVLGLRKKSIFSFAIIFYFISYALTANIIVKIPSSFGERLLFVPSLGYCIALPFVIALFLKIDLKKTMQSNATKLIGILGVVIVLYGFKTISRNPVWKNTETLCVSGITSSPNSARTHLSYADFLMDKIQTNISMEERMVCMTTALEEYKKFDEIYQGHEPAYFNMAILYYAMRDTMNAIKMYEKIIQINPKNNGALTNYGIILLDKQDYQKALSNLLKAAEVSGNNFYPNIYLGIGMCYQGLKLNEKAIPYFEKVVQADANNQMAIQKLYTIYSLQGDTAKAKYYSRMVR